MQKIIPHLWFDKEAREVAEFYVSAFGGDSMVRNVQMIHDTPSGDAEMVKFRLRGYEFQSISAGPRFHCNSSISFFVNFDPSRDTHARENLDSLWRILSDCGKAFMPIDKYHFSERYGWIQDRYGVSWQLILTNPAGDQRPDIAPSLMFVGSVAGRAEEAMKFYAATFGDSKVGGIFRYGPNQLPDKEGTVAFEDFMLLGQWFAAMDSAMPHMPAFNEAISLMVMCESQQEIDRYWNALSSDPKAEQCGWCRDKFGVSWQIIPSIMGEMMKGTGEQRARVTSAFLKMKKFDIGALKRVFAGA